MIVLAGNFEGCSDSNNDGDNDDCTCVQCQRVNDKCDSVSGSNSDSNGNSDGVTASISAPTLRNHIPYLP